VGFDMARVAADAGSVISAAMFGAVAASGALPFARAEFEATVERGGIGVAASLRAFAAAFDAAGGPATAPPAVPARPADIPRAGIPAPALDFVAEGIRRMTDFQDAAYAELYSGRVAWIARLDDGRDGFKLTVETARQLALAMAYEDTIRVADLKTRASRFARVAQEVGVRDGQVLEIAEYLHPRLQEVAETLPAWLGRFVLGNPFVRRLVTGLTSTGRRVRTTSLGGFLLLYLVAGLRPIRRSTLRYAAEQASLERWLALVAAHAPAEPALALEIVACRNLVKGYGDTHARGTASYEAILAELDRMPVGTDRAARVAALRRAAGADDSGAALAAALRAA
jgi:indolepyruvate ferredoxin oxidoreductase beta subunit